MQVNATTKGSGREPDRQASVELGLGRKEVTTDEAEEVEERVNLCEVAAWMR